MNFMPYIPPDTLAKIKQIDLFSYLKTYAPSELVRISGSVYRMRSHESLKISNGKWMWWSRGIGGRSALDYLIKVEGYSFLEAADLIMSQASLQPPEILPAEKTKEKILFLPEPYCNCDYVVSYLKSRGIDSDLIRFCIQTGRLYESRNYHNAVFVGQDSSGKARYAALRGVRSALLERQLEVIRTILFVSRQRKPARVSICLSQPLIFCLTLLCERWTVRTGEWITCYHWREYISLRKRLRKARSRQPYPGF